MQGKNKPLIRYLDKAISGVIRKSRISCYPRTRLKHSRTGSSGTEVVIPAKAGI